MEMEVNSDPRGMALSGSQEFSFLLTRLIVFPPWFL